MFSRKLSVAAIFGSILIGSVSEAARNSHQYLEDQISQLQSKVASLESKLEKQDKRFKKHDEKMRKEASTFLSPGWEVKTEDGRHWFSIGGRIMWDVHSLHPDQNVSAITGASGKDGVEFRKTRLFFNGRMDGRLSYQLQYDFTQGGIAAMKATYLKYLNSKGYSFWVGNVKEPFSMETLTSSKYESFLEESAATRTFSPSYNPGFMLMNQDPNDRVGWAFGLFRTDAGGFGQSPNAPGPNFGGWNFTGRLGWTALYENDGEQTVHLGLGLSRRNINGGALQYTSVVENHFYNMPLLNTGVMAADDADYMAYEFAWVNGPLSLQGEFYDVNVDMSAPGAADANFDGYYLEGSYWLTGERRRYSRKYRFFSRVKPMSNFFDGGTGAWQVLLRKSNVDLNDPVAGVAGREADTWTFGTNWHLDARTRIMLNVIDSEILSGPGTKIGDTRSLSMRFQVDF